jgi:hypothetical protein
MDINQLLMKAGEILVQGVPVALLAILVWQAVRMAFPGRELTKYSRLGVILLALTIGALDHYLSPVAEWFIPFLWAGAGAPVLFDGIKNNFANPEKK